MLIQIKVYDFAMNIIIQFVLFNSCNSQALDNESNCKIIPKSWME